MLDGEPEIRHQDGSGRLLIVQELMPNERIYWLWSIEQAKFTQSVVFDLLYTAQELRRAAAEKATVQ